jgi:probable non-F420 flavinoid oxidoreductase
MTTIGFHASHEQLPPSALLRCTEAAAEAGFDAFMCSDHLAPWSVRQGQSGFAWSWLGAALARTELPAGLVTAPGQRYHPVVLAQALATLGEMFPGRAWAACGSGEALNEHVTGDRWPPKRIRNERLRESVDVMRALLAGETVTHQGHIRVDRARLWSLPEEPPALLGAATTPETAGWLAGWTDGLITVNQPLESLREVLDTYREGSGDRAKVAVQAHLSWADDEDEALAVAHDQWRNMVFGGDISWNLETPEQFDLVGDPVSTDQVREAVIVGSDLGHHAEALRAIVELGVDELYLHHVSKDEKVQQRFIERFASDVLPSLR